MATATRVTRVANPRRKRNYRRRKANPKMVRNRHGQFVKKARKSRTRVRRTANYKRRRTNPKRRSTARTHRRKRNPVLIELGAINPFRGATRKRRKNVATRKRRKSRNPRRRRHVTAVAPVRRRRRRNSSKRTYRRRRNPAMRVTRRRRRRSMNPVGRRRRSYRRSYRRNPSLFGKSGGKDLLTMIGGGLVGVAATKFLPTLVPSSLMSSLGASPILGIGLTIAGAFVASWIGKKVNLEFGEAVLFGGLMQAGSQILTAFAPASISSQLALSGLGDIVPGWFAVPQNPVTNRAPMAMVAAPSGGGGMGAAIPRPFGRR